MELLNKLTLKNLLLNKKRTIVTVIGIMLSVSLLTAVAAMFFSARYSLIKHETEQGGNFHYKFQQVPREEAEALKEHRKLEKIFFTSPVGYASLKEIQNEYKPYVYVQAVDKDAMNHLGIRLTKGRLPENEREILISSHLNSNGGVALTLGEKIALNVGQRTRDGYELAQDNPFVPESGETIVNAVQKEYVIVGEMKRLATEIEPYSAPGYTFFTCLREESPSDYVDVYIRYNKDDLKDHDVLTAGILGVDEKAFCTLLNGSAFFSLDQESQNEILEKTQEAKYNYSYNKYLVALETGMIGNSTLNALAAAAGVVVIIIIFTSVFCIKNSFDISITEKIRQYGMLSSIGATKKQIRKNVYYEAAILGAFGIPLGLLAGILATMVLIQVSNHFLRGDLNFTLYFNLSLQAVLIAILLGAVTIFLSARRSAVKASKITPIHAIRNSEELRIHRKKIHSPAWVKKIFGIGGEISYKNLQRSKKKYRTTIISISVCVTVFIALHFFVDYTFRMVENELGYYGYSIVTTYTTDGTDHFAEEVRNLDHIKDVNVINYASVILDEVPFSEEYQQYRTDLGEEPLTSDNEEIRLWTHIMAEEDFKQYVKELHLSYDEVKEKGILINQIDLFYYPAEGQDYVEKRIDMYDWKKGDKVTGYVNLRGEENETIQREDFEVEIGYVSDEVPMGVQTGGPEALFIINEGYEKKLAGSNYRRSIYIDSSDAVQNEKDVEEIFAEYEKFWEINNIQENIERNESTYTLIAIFLYGFITVIALISVTNIFNTVTTNMNLRRREFAMLQSIGMTEKEFTRMIALESFFYGMRSLMIGVPLGVLVSYIIFRVMMSGSFQMKYELPIAGILIAISAVFLLLWAIMSYSMNRIREQNMIETIRNENI